jgi:two-component system, sensor histidine kinase and response regulator
MLRDATAQRGVFLSTVPPSSRERRFARIIVVVSFALFALLAPFAKVRLAEVWAFVPVYQSALLVTDLITAILLFSQFVILDALALLILAAGYLFAALMTVPHTLSFPRLFAPEGLIGAGAQTTAWLYIIWRSGLPVAAIAYALLRRSTGVRRRGRAVAIACTAVVALVIGAGLLATVGHAMLPAVMLGDGYTPLLPLAVSCVWTLNLVALVVLWRRRPYSSLDMWLMVVFWIRLFDIALSAMLNAGRFDLGFYAGRTFGFMAGGLVLLVLLIETGALYARLARSFERERRDRDLQLRRLEAELSHVARLTELGQMVSALAHEVNQPLTAVGTYMRAGLRLAQAGDVPRAVDALQKGSEQVTRASQVIQRLRQFVRKEDGHRGAEDIHRTIDEVAALAMLGAEGRRVRLERDFAPGTPPVLIDKVQIQQVLLNLIRNAIEAMQPSAHRDLVIRTTQSGDGMVEVRVADSGPGLSRDIRSKLFQPFATTKATGMGVGLSICRAIVEAHGGRIWASDPPAGGTEFHFTLPAAGAHPAEPAKAGVVADA